MSTRGVLVIFALCLMPVLIFLFAYLINFELFYLRQLRQIYLSEQTNQQNNFANNEVFRNLIHKLHSQSVEQRFNSINNAFDVRRPIKKTLRGKTSQNYRVFHRNRRDLNSVFKLDNSTTPQSDLTSQNLTSVTDSTFNETYGSETMINYYKVDNRTNINYVNKPNEIYNFFLNDTYKRTAAPRRQLVVKEMIINSTVLPTVFVTNHTQNLDKDLNANDNRTNITIFEKYENIESDLIERTNISIDKDFNFTQTSVNNGTEFQEITLFPLNYSETMELTTSKIINEYRLVTTDQMLVNSTYSIGISLVSNESKSEINQILNETAINIFNTTTSEEVENLTSSESLSTINYFGISIEPDNYTKSDFIQYTTESNMEYSKSHRIEEQNKFTTSRMFDVNQTWLNPESTIDHNETNIYTVKNSSEVTTEISKQTINQALIHQIPINVSFCGETFNSSKRNELPKSNENNYFQKMLIDNSTKIDIELNLTNLSTNSCNRTDEPIECLPCNQTNNWIYDSLIYELITGQTCQNNTTNYTQIQTFGTLLLPCERSLHNGLVFGFYGDSEQFKKFEQTVSENRTQLAEVMCQMTCLHSSNCSTSESNISFSVKQDILNPRFVWLEARFDLNFTCFDRLGQSDNPSDQYVDLINSVQSLMSAKMYALFTPNSIVFPEAQENQTNRMNTATVGSVRECVLFTYGVVLFHLAMVLVHIFVMLMNAYIYYRNLRKASKCSISHRTTPPGSSNCTQRATVTPNGLECDEEKSGENTANVQMYRNWVTPVENVQSETKHNVIPLNDQTIKKVVPDNQTTKRCYQVNRGFILSERL